MVGPTVDPQGTGPIAQWARRKRVAHQVRPEQGWFRKWEPFDTMISPTCFLNALSWPAPPGNVTLAEPWTEEGDEEPMDRTIIAFVSHPGLRLRASMHAGEHFITRVTFLEDPPLPEVQLGDPLWDQHVVTRGASVEEAAAAFHPALRQLLAGWGFQGHLELRPCGLVLHYAGLKPTPEHLSRMSRIVPEVVTAALRYSE
ncbi:MAG: hypothetical protein JRI23_03090 [Deltaproteobacteria bacterium]|nr:hypothetical protein [Deltaproteobacteria bacterium]MBW2530490.1 hypothetical protein [Deltaproteobacteria bacterium]